jgi:XTP/dITP diphosphohydrolase
LNESQKAFQRLLTIMDELREQCPWDKKQTIHTLRHLTIEETYELADAITSNDWKGIKEELGDLMLHMVFYAKIASEQAHFNIADALNAVCEKLISRHPHIYGDVKVNNEEDVKQNWEKLKLKEGKKSVLGGVPGALPALVKAVRLQDKARQVGFEWDHAAQVWEKVEEETQELQEAVASGNADKMEEELGDLIFSLVNFARFLQIDPENALERTNRKFLFRFNAIEEEAARQGRHVHDLSLTEMDEIWNRVKRKQPGSP